MSRAELEGVLRDYLGINQRALAGQGIAGDDTHGHVDDVCRFVGPQTGRCCSEEPNPHDANHRSLAENSERLQGCGGRPGRSST